MIVMVNFSGDFGKFLTVNLHMKVMISETF